VEEGASAASFAAFRHSPQMAAASDDASP